MAYRRLIVVTGSGVSVGTPTEGSGPRRLPTWYAVLEQLRSRFADQLASIRPQLDVLLHAYPLGADYLIEAATLIRECVGVADYRDAVVQLTTAPQDSRSELHDLIEQLQPLGIMTFNYDLGHENAYRIRSRVGRRMRRAVYADERMLRAIIADDFQSRFLLKAHGCISRPKTIVLDRASYREVMARQPGYRAFAHHILARFTALIVGFGLNDPDFEDLLQSFETSFGGGVGEHVYIWKRGQRDDEEARALVLRRRYGLACIFVDSFDDIRAVISDARSQIGPRLDHTLRLTLKRGDHVEQFRRVRRRAHLALGHLSAAGAQSATTALRAVLADPARPPWIRAEAAYSLGKIRPICEGTADVLFDLIEARAPAPVITLALAALLQLEPPVDEQLEVWLKRALALRAACSQTDSQTEVQWASGERPRAVKYLEALIARWAATGVAAGPNPLNGQRQDNRDQE